MDILNHHHLNAWVILPGTETRNCAFAELLAGQRQPPMWFCSHWWGDLLIDFMDCLQRHSTLRNGSPAETPYWLSAFACRQHQPISEIADDPGSSNFAKALQAAQNR